MYKRQKEGTGEDEMREIRMRIVAMVAVRRRGEADARSVRGQKERITIAYFFAQIAIFYSLLVRIVVFS